MGIICKGRDVCMQWIATHFFLFLKMKSVSILSFVTQSNKLGLNFSMISYMNLLIFNCN